MVRIELISMTMIGFPDTPECPICRGDLDDRCGACRDQDVYLPCPLEETDQGLIHHHCRTGDVLADPSSGSE